MMGTAIPKISISIIYVDASEYALYLAAYKLIKVTCRMPTMSDMYDVHSDCLIS